MRLERATDPRIIPLNPPSEYEQKLERMSVPDLMHELEEATINFYVKRYRVGDSCEKLRLCKRELARRLFASPLSAA